MKNPRNEIEEKTGFDWLKNHENSELIFPSYLKLFIDLMLFMKNPQNEIENKTKLVLIG